MQILLSAVELVGDFRLTFGAQGVNVGAIPMAFCEETQHALLESDEGFLAANPNHDEDEHGEEEDEEGFE